MLSELLDKLLVLIGRDEEAELEKLVSFFGGMVTKLEDYQTKLAAKIGARQAKIDQLQGQVDNLGDLSAQARKTADNIKKIVS